MPGRFDARKRHILDQLSAPDGAYHDLSPKGSIDEPIRALIGEINRLEGLVTTSSCSGRISVFLEGRKSTVHDPELEEASPAGPGGKGGGSWLFVSHNSVSVLEDKFSSLTSTLGLKNPDAAHDESPSVNSSYIHLKFEPMILHLLTASLEDSQRVLTAAMGAGFRESGAVGLKPAKDGELNPMVAVRSTGYSFDAIIGFQDSSGHNIPLADETYLRILVGIANERFNINTERRARFRALLLEQYEGPPVAAAELAKPHWEDPETRRQRKREEGLARQRATRAQDSTETVSAKPNTLGSRVDGMLD